MRFPFVRVSWEHSELSSSNVNVGGMHCEEMRVRRGEEVRGAVPQADMASRGG